MRKLLIFIPILICIGIMLYFYHPKHRLIGEIVIYYEKMDEPYRMYGTYKRIIKRYNYYYYDSTYHFGKRIDSLHGWDYYTNEYGDTTCIIFTDYTNYPRRKE